jgi:hypothetical protein
MDFNEIQNAWNEENTENVFVTADVMKIQSANTPLDKIRKNLKMDFFYQIVSIVLFGFFPLLYSFPPQLTVFFYLLYSLIVAVSIYYLVKLYFFYKRINVITLKTKDSLYETYFDIRLNMELYKTFGFAITPFLILFSIGYLYFDFSATSVFVIVDYTISQLLGMFSIVVFSMLFMAVAVEWWVYYFYGKHAREIRAVLDELKEE